MFCRHFVVLTAKPTAGLEPATPSLRVIPGDSPWFGQAGKCLLISDLRAGSPGRPERARTAEPDADPTPQTTTRFPETRSWLVALMQRFRSYSLKLESQARQCLNCFPG